MTGFSEIFPHQSDKFMIYLIKTEDLHEISLWPKFSQPFSWANYNLMGQEAHQKWIDRNSKGSTYWFVIKENQKIISRGSLIIPEEQDELIFGIVVKPNLLNQGLGTKCVSAIVEMVFSKTNFSSIWLETKESNMRARKVWEKIGFQTTDMHYRKDAFGVYARYMGYRLKKSSQFDL